MPNLTLSFSENLLKKGRKHASKHGKSLNGLIRELVSREIEHQSTDWLDNSYSLMDKAKANSRGIKWNRDSLYER